jgi:hypothetical protein
MMYGEGFGMKPKGGAVGIFWRNLGKTRKTGGVPVEIRTEQFMNTGIERYV